MRLSILSLAVLSAVLLVGPQCHGPRQIAMAQDPPPGPAPTPQPVPVPPAPPKAEIISNVKSATQGQCIFFKSGASGGVVTWKTVPECPGDVTMSGSYVVSAEPPFDIVQVVTAIGADGKPIVDVDVVRIELIQPTPQPGPTPTPTPTPTPVDPAPITDDGFRVLIIYESSDMTKYSLEQQMILAGADVRDFLNQNCVKEGNTPSYRMFDPDVDLKSESPIWQKAMARPRTEIPWVIISNGKTGFEGPLPKTPTAFLELCKKYLPTK